MYLHGKEIPSFMKQNKWPDFLFTITVRLICGIVLGGLASFLFAWTGVLRTLSHNNTHRSLIWLGLWGLAGAIIAVCTIPRWQTPWYKRDSGALDLMAELKSLGQDGDKPTSKSVSQVVTIKTVGEYGQAHEYSSLEEVPPEIRSEIEALEKEAAQGKGRESSVKEISRTGGAIT